MTDIRALPRRDRRAAKRYIEAENAKWPENLVVLPRADWPASALRATKPPAHMWRSRHFLVQVFDEPAGVIRLSICRTAVAPSGDWQDRITWEELQDLKRQVGCRDLDAVEIFPADRDIVNVANMRHLWVLPLPLALAWFHSQARSEEMWMAAVDIAELCARAEENLHDDCGGCQGCAAIYRKMRERLAAFAASMEAK